MNTEQIYNGLVAGTVLLNQLARKHFTGDLVTSPASMKLYRAEQYLRRQAEKLLSE